MPKSKKVAGARVVVKSKYFNEFNDLEGVIVKEHEWGKEQLIVELDDKQGTHAFSRDQLKLIKT